MIGNIDDKTIVEITSFPLWKRKNPNYNDREIWKKLGRKLEWEDFKKTWTGRKVGDLRNEYKRVLQNLDISWIYSKNGDGVTLNVILNNCWKFPVEAYNVINTITRDLN